MKLNHKGKSISFLEIAQMNASTLVDTGYILVQYVQIRFWWHEFDE